jgi:hypothetical protein
MIRCVRLSALIWGVIFSSSVDASDTSGLKISAAADLVADFGWQDVAASQRLQARSVELLLYGPTDHLFQGMISVAAHPYDGEMNVGVHEAYISSSRLIPKARFRLGQFFLGVGRLNPLHQHDWPFITAPFVQREFFDGEGILDSGLEVAFLMPTSFYWDVSAGVTSGWRITHSHGDQGEAPSIPTHYLRSEFFHSWGNGGVKTGLNYLGRKDASESWLWMLGADVTAKWRRGKVLSWLAQSEAWLRLQKPQTLKTTRELGAFVFLQKDIHESFFGGLRLDALSQLDLKNAQNESLMNIEWGLSPQLTYEASEFAKWRAAYALESRYQEGVATSLGHRLSLQAVFLLGAHPAHEF